MKRLLGLLLVMGMVGCGEKENAGNAVDPGIGADEQLVTESGGEKSDPSNPNVKVDEPPVQAVDVDPVAELENLGAKVKRNEQGEVIEVSFYGKSETNVTDSALMHFKQLTSLKSLDLGIGLGRMPGMSGGRGGMQGMMQGMQKDMMKRRGGGGNESGDGGSGGGRGGRGASAPQGID